MCAPRFPSVAPESALRRTNSSISRSGSAFSAEMILSRTGWWMSASGCSATSDAPHPETAEDQSAAADTRHPVEELLRHDEVAERRQRDQRKAQRQHAPAFRPYADEAVEKPDDDREHRTDLVVVQRRHDRAERGEED